MTITGKDGTYPMNIKRRITEVLAISSPTGFSVHGDSTTIAANTITNVFSQNGIYNRLQTGAVTNEAAMVSGGLIYNRQKEPSFYCRFKLGSASNVRMFIGLTDQNPDLPLFSTVVNGNYAGLYANPAISSGWRLASGNGGTFTTSTVTGSVDTGYHDFYMWLKKQGAANSMILQLDSGTRYEISSPIPAITAQLRYVVGIGNVSNISKNIEIAKISINTEI